MVNAGISQEFLDELVSKLVLKGYSARPRC